MITIYFELKKIGIRRRCDHLVGVPYKEDAIRITNDYFITVSVSKSLECGGIISIFFSIVIPQ